ncbi:MAG: hypothetical protein PWQ57_1221 [Desulfovibrionales bacterium]|nr:hypothetical protein [Desulfovibrionales bacterium]
MREQDTPNPRLSYYNAAMKLQFVTRVDLDMLSGDADALHGADLLLKSIASEAMDAAKQLLGVATEGGRHV